jgi:hypothetical protein
MAQSRFVTEDSRELAVHRSPYSFARVFMQQPVPQEYRLLLLWLIDNREG